MTTRDFLKSKEPLDVHRERTASKYIKDLREWSNGLPLICTVVLALLALRWGLERPIPLIFLLHHSSCAAVRLMLGDGLNGFSSIFNE